MTYQSLARKWRPQTFDEITGQEVVTQTLKNAITANRLHHAYLFSGPRGTGKTTMARLLAKALNCLSGITQFPCGNCHSCLEISRGNSIDVLEIDAASYTGVDNIRDVIINTVANRPARDRYKIFIIDEVHMLSMNAFNALLKTLEEPPIHVTFIMATTELHKLPETILSRCQHLEFHTINVEKISTRLKEITTAESVDINEGAIKQIAYAGRGSLRDALSALDQVIAFAGSTINETDVTTALGIVSTQLVTKILDALVAQDSKQMLLTIDELVKTGCDFRQFIHEIMRYIRHLLIIKTAGTDSALLPIVKSDLAQLENYSNYFSNEELLRIFSLLTEIEQNIRVSNEPRFQLEFGLVKLAQLTKLKNLEKILEDIQKLSKKTPTETSLNTVKKFEETKTLKSNNESIRNISSVQSEKVIEKQPINNLPIDAPIGSENPITTEILINQIKTNLESRNKMLLLAAMEKVEQVELNETEVVFIFQAGATELYKQVSQPTGLVILQDIVHKILGRHIKMRLKQMKNDLSTPDLNIQEPKTSAFEQAANNPIVKSLVNVFRGELIDVRTSNPQ